MLKIVERIYVVIALLYFAGGLSPSDEAELHVNPELNRISIILQLIIYSILLVIVLVRLTPVLRGVRVSGWIMGICALAVLSTAWSSEPMITLRRSIILLIASMFAIYLASCFDWDEQLNLFAWMIVVAIALSVVVAVFFPAYGVSHDLHWGDWRGSFGHKNQLGQVMAFGLLLLSIAKPQGLPSWSRVLILLAAVFLLYSSGSATAFVTVALIALAYPLLHVLRVRTRRTLPLWVAIAPLVLLGGLLLVFDAGNLLRVVGRDDTLTGRIPLWSSVTEAIKERSLLGYGYSVFWVLNNPDSNGVITAIGWYPLQSHNGYLDIGLDLGVVGLLLFVCSLAVVGRRALNLFKECDRGALKWPLICLLFIVVYNFAESNLLRSRSFIWLPYVSIYITLALMQAETRRGAVESALASHGRDSASLPAPPAGGE